MAVGLPMESQPAGSLPLLPLAPGTRLASPPGAPGKEVKLNGKNWT